MTTENPDLHGNAPDRSSTVMVILDLFSDFDFDDGRALVTAAQPIAKRIAHLKQRARRRGVACVYVNDNVGRWRSDFAGVLQHCMREGSRGAAIARLLAPGTDDYCILKPKHSAFFATPLHTLLRHLGTEELVITGVTSHQCVLFTAIDAYVRDLRLRVPRDCIGAARPADTRLALRYLDAVLHADVRESSAIRFARRR